VVPIPVPKTREEIAQEVQQRADYYAACLILDEAALRFAGHYEKRDTYPYKPEVVITG
jgi:hypothetical protein